MILYHGFAQSKVTSEKLITINFIIQCRESSSCLLLHIVHYLSHILSIHITVYSSDILFFTQQQESIDYAETLASRECLCLLFFTQQQESIDYADETPRSRECLCLLFFTKQQESIDYADETPRSRECLFIME